MANLSRDKSMANLSRDKFLSSVSVKIYLLPANTEIMTIDPIVANHSAISAFLGVLCCIVEVLGVKS